MADVRKGYVSVNENCIGCGRCMLDCPASDTNISVYRNGRRMLEVNPVNCISCGGCVNLCSHGAREYIDDTDDFLAALEAGEKVSVIVSTGFYITYGKRAYEILGHLRSLGVSNIYDAGFGADVFVYLSARYIKEYSGDTKDRPFILNACPTVLNYIQRYVPESIKYIIPVQSPPLCTAIYAKKYLHDGGKLAYLSSCVTRRSEFDLASSAGLVDYCVTFGHLMKRIGNDDMSGKSSISDLTAPGFGNIISAGTGLREYIASLFSDDEIIVDYKKLDERTTALISSVRDPNVPHPFIVSVVGCEMGCATGGGIDISVQNNYETYLNALQQLRRESNEKRRDYPSHWELYRAVENNFIDLDPKDFAADFENRYVQLHSVPEHIINEIFERMRMTTEEKRHTDCRACGYKTCRDMASAVAKGYARIEDCARYVNEEFRRKLFFDDLTGIMSAAGFHAEVPLMLMAGRDKKYVICTGNINGLKTINDLYNFNLGSQVIVYVARMLSNIVNGIGICARLGGNNFVMCFENTEENLRRLMAIRYFDCGEMGIGMPVTMRFGLCEVSGMQDIRRITNYASFAMEKAIDRSRNSFRWYDDDMRNEIMTEAAITSQMRTAMYNNEFTMYLQPQYSHSTGALVGAETLCRWVKPDGTMISPAVFIPIFEKNGFIKKLDRYMWECAFRQVRKWMDEGRKPVPLSVNISRINLRDDEIIDIIEKLQETYSIDRELLHFEITESAYSSDQDSLIRRITRIREMGFLIAMDDFGSGYSSLNTLKDIPIDILKLDMGFLRGESNEDKGGNIISAVIMMAHSLGLVTIAEGVETVEQADFLKSRGCDVIQGYLYARPMPVDKFDELMKNGSGDVSFRSADESKDALSTLFRRNSSGMHVFEKYVGPAAIFEYKTDDLKVEIVNDMLVEMLGYKNVAPVEFSRTFAGHIRAADRPALDKTVGRVIAGEDGAVCIFGYERPDGKEILVRAKIWYLGNKGDSSVIYTVADDVTDVLSYRKT